ncbi:DUF503 domain-containing protein [Coprothermobacter platensis]|uniref:DUF503 domain-containing protein n=1 Tax=Coprothermobacter platensis TaxID=108819 RepID=UPI0003738A06|nr:DUF503 domain-containing protein [Coprothermobacter platensis]
MFVGTLKLTLLIAGSRTLKDKRQVVRSILDTVKARRNMSTAEIGSLDNTSVAELGFATVGNQMQKVRESIEWVIDFVENNYELEIIDKDINIY